VDVAIVMDMPAGVRSAVTASQYVTASTTLLATTVSNARHFSMIDRGGLLPRRRQMNA